jgi:hypothetical protein
MTNKKKETVKKGRFDHLKYVKLSGNTVVSLHDKIFPMHRDLRKKYVHYDPTLDEVEVKVGFIYDRENKTFSAPPPPTPLTTEQKHAKIDRESHKRMQSLLPYSVLLHSLTGGLPIPSEITVQADKLRNSAEKLKVEFKEDYKHDKHW